MQKIAFFDIDGTLTSELDGSIPDSAVLAVRRARGNAPAETECRWPLNTP